MAVAYGEIARVLDGARRRHIRITLLAAAALGSGGVLAALVLGATAVVLGARLAIIRPVALTAAWVALVAAAAWAIRALVRAAWTPEATARAVTRSSAALRSDLVSAVQLARAREEVVQSGRFSVDLLDAHVSRTAERACALDLAGAIPDRPMRQGGRALLAIAGAGLLLTVATRGALVGAAGRIVAGEPPGARQVALDPITGDIEITYLFPAYMHREPQTLSGTGGEVRAPKGTEVRLKTRADRPVKAAEIAVSYAADQSPSPAARNSSPSPPARAGGEGRGEGPARAGARGRRKGPAPAGGESRGEGQALTTHHYALKLSGDRNLSGRFVVEEGGSYRFRFLDAKGRATAEGPPIPVVVEPDAFPEVRITTPADEIEVDAAARVRVEWQASDDYGLADLVLVTKQPGGDERRRPLKRLEGVRRDSGGFDLDLVPERLGEGEKLLYWLEVTDTDAVSGPKRGASGTHVVKIYSEAEHRRVALERARAAWEEMVSLLGDRLEFFAVGPAVTADRIVRAEAFDVRTRHLHENMREASAALRKEKAAPRAVAIALANVASSLRLAEQRLTSVRQLLIRLVRSGGSPDPGSVRQGQAFDGQLDDELEKGILYLEQLLDKTRAEDLVRLAKDLASKRRDLAGLLEKYRRTPSEAAKKDILAQIARMKERMREMMARMSELARGFQDEHLNSEALAELQRSQDVAGGLDQIEKMLAKGDVEGAMKALDGMAGAMDRMVAGLQRSAGIPDENSRALMKEMLAFKEQLEKVQREQERVAGETEKVRQEYRKKLEKKLREAEAMAKRLERLAQEARQDIQAAEPGVTGRAEPDHDASKEGLEATQRALAMKDFDAALQTIQRTLPSMQRLAMALEEERIMADRYAQVMQKSPEAIREAERRSQAAIPKALQIQQELSKLFPDARTVLGPQEQQRMQELARRQSDLEQKAGGLQQKLSELMQQAPVFPPGAAGQLGDSRGHMGQAASELAQRNPQRGKGEQQLAMDDLERFRKGLEDAARKGGGASGGPGFPFPFAEQGGEESGEGFDPSREKVEIPGAEAYKPPQEFRKDLLDAMKQGAPERYKSEVQRYYEELVK